MATAAADVTDAERPIYIGGPDRCGKTLVSALLGSHSRIAISPVGSNLWTLFYGRFGDLRRDENFDRCFAALMRYKHVRFLQPDADPIRSAFLSGDRTYARLFALIQEDYARRLGKPRWGDQTGLVEGYADEIFAAWPEARMVHMVRDPRDRYEASLALWPSGRLRAGGATARWLYSVELAERNAERFGGRYRILHYETLVREPEATVRDLCAFLGEEYEPGMLELRDFPSYRAKLVGDRGPDVSAADLISPAFIGAYRGKIAPAELKFIEQHAGEAMRRHAYQPDGVELRGLSRLRYALLDLPQNLLRMRVWQVRQAVAQRLPRYLGRRPRAAMAG